MGTRGKPRVSSQASGSAARVDGGTWLIRGRFYRDNANELLNEYLNAVGGHEAIFGELEKVKKTKKRGRTAGASGSTTKRARKQEDDDSESPAPRTLTEKTTWQPPAGSWEDKVESVDVVQDEVNGNLMVYLVWNNGKKTKHETSVVYKRCPQKVRHTLFPSWPFCCGHQAGVARVLSLELTMAE